MQRAIFIPPLPAVAPLGAGAVKTPEILLLALRLDA
jgi:hypothetical protein